METTNRPPTPAPARGGDETWPHIMQIAAMLCDSSGMPQQMVGKLVDLPENSFVHPQASKVHGIDPKDARRYGMPERSVLRDIHDFVRKTDIIVGHSAEFERGMLLNRARLLGIDRATLLRKSLRWFCTMKNSTEACNLRRDDGTRKWPTLDEACEALLGEAPRQGKHSAWEDVQRTHRLWMHLVENDLVNLGP